MILTGSEIVKEIEKNNIFIEPFNKSQVNPNSYNYRLGKTLVLISEKGNQEILIPETGYVLEPKKTYLGCTEEILGSKKYAMRLIGRSSMGRLGLFLQISADLGHTGSAHKWTLELVSLKKLKIYPGMIIGQISFWENNGEIIPNCDGYANYSMPKESKGVEIDINR